MGVSRTQICTESSPVWNRSKESHERAKTSRLLLPSLTSVECHLMESNNDGNFDPDSGFKLRPRAARSRTTCRTCISRRIKCDEGFPSCRRCLRVGRKCSYLGRSLFRHRTRKTMTLLQKEMNVILSGNPVWDRTLSSSLLLEPQV